MKRPGLTLLVAVALCATSLPLMAQQKRLSPQATITATIDGNDMKIVYSRPYTKHPKTGEVRKIWGGLVPYGKVWRTGANEATLLTTAMPIKIGDTTVPAGTYSLYTLPVEDGTSKLIINKQTGQWGTQYDQKQDLARVDLKKSSLDEPVHQFTMAIDKQASGGGVIKLMWEKTEYSVAFTVEK